MQTTTRQPAKTARGAARQIAEWLQRHEVTRAYDPTVEIVVGVDRTRPGSIVIHDAESAREYIGYEALAGVAYEGGPDEWTFMGIVEAEQAGEINLGEFWAEAANGWSVLIYRF